MSAVLRSMACCLAYCAGACHAQESLNYKSKVAAPQANYYVIAAETDSLLKTLPTDTAWESQGLFFARWKWFWGSRMGDGIDGAKTGKFTHYAGVMKSMVETPPCMSSSAYPANWNLLGPIQLPRQEMGWINAVALDPNNPLVAYAGAPNGGLWRTLDIEAAQPVWQNITDQTGLPGMGIGDILIDPSNSDILYIATGYYTGSEIQYGVGVMKTTNGTDPLPTWEFTGLNFNPFQGEVAAVKKLIMSPVDHNTIYAYTAKEVYKTTNAGSTWNTLGLGDAITYGNRNAEGMVLDPLNHADILVSVVDSLPKLWHWNNSTTQWNEVTPNLTAVPKRTVVLATSLNNVYALYLDTNGVKRIDVSMDGGITWTLHETTTHYGPILLVSEADQDIMYIGDVTVPNFRTIFKSINGGASFVEVSNYWPEYDYHGVYTHGDIRALELIGASPGGLNDTIMAGTDGGVLYSTSAMHTPTVVMNWKNANGIGLAVGQFYGLAGSEKVPGRIIGGAQDNGLATYESGSWINKVVGDAYEVVIDRETPDVAIGEKIDWGTKLNAPYRHYLTKTADAGQNWSSSITHPSWGNPFNPDNNTQGGVPYSPDVWNVRDSPIQIDQSNNLHLGFHDLFRYNPANNSWAPLSDFTAAGVPPYLGCSAFAIAPSNPDVIYFGFENPTWDGNNLDKKLWRTADGGISWTDITNGIPVDGVAVSGIAVDPNNANRVWVSCSQLQIWGEMGEPYNGSKRVYYSADDGTTWTDYSKGLTPLPINVITYEQGTNDGLYVGTDVGVFYTNRNLYDADDMANPQNTGWVCFRDNLPPCIVTDLEVNYASNRLRAPTFGRGIWESSLACPLHADLHFTTATATGLSGTFQEASNDLSVTADAGNINLTGFTGRAGNTVHLAATGTSSLHLGPGSHLFIHPCDGPGNSFQPKMVMSGTTNSLEEEDETEKGAADLQVFPNPSTGTVTVQLREADPVQVSTLRLFDGMGKLLLTRTMTGERAELELHQPDGMYTVVVIHGSEEYSARIILKAP